jgi:hypothetical protein
MGASGSPGMLQGLRRGGPRTWRRRALAVGVLKGFLPGIALASRKQARISGTPTAEGLAPLLARLVSFRTLALSPQRRRASANASSSVEGANLPATSARQDSVSAHDGHSQTGQQRQGREQ